MHLRRYARRPDVLVLALPRGGVPVGFEIARALDVPLEILLVRKLGVPDQEELAMGAVVAGGIRVLNEGLIRRLGISPAAIEEVAAREEAELERQSQVFRNADDPPVILRGKTVILVDDGLATGATMAVSIEAVRRQEPHKIVVAVPVAPPDTCKNMKQLADEMVCGATPERFGAVGQWYSDFSAVSDDVVRDLLRQAHAATGRTPHELS